MQQARQRVLKASNQDGDVSEPGRRGAAANLALPSIPQVASENGDGCLSYSCPGLSSVNLQLRRLLAAARLAGGRKYGVNLADRQRLAVWPIPCQLNIMLRYRINMLPMSCRAD